MTSEEIALLHKRVEERAERFHERLRANPNRNLDAALANLIETEGWDIIRYSLEGMICELLEPEEFGQSSEAYAVSGESRRLTIKAIRAVIESVESAAAVRGAEKAPDKTTEGVSE